jgi:predicted secreted protein
MTLHVGSVGPPIRGNTFEPEVYRQGIYALAEGRVGVVKAADFAVTQNGTPNMSVNVAAGIAIVQGTANVPVQGIYNAYNDATVNLALAASNATNPRIDLICLTIDDQFYGSADNTSLLQVVTGTPAASPAVPATPANTLVLAHVYVTAATTTILNAAINGTAGTGNPDTIAFTPGRCIAIQAMAAGTGGTCTSTASPGTLIPGLTVVVNTPAGRNIKVSYSCPYTGSASSLTNAIVYRDGATIVTDAYCIGANNGFVSGVGVDQPPAGSHTYQVNMWAASAQTETFTASRGRLIVEDAGPV